MKIFTTILLHAAVFTCVSLKAQSAWRQKTDFGGNAKYGSVAFSIGTKAYLVAGRDAVNKSDVWEYDSSTDTWTQKTDFPGAARYQAVAFTIGAKGYVATGAAGSTFPFSPVYNDLWEYDPGPDTWVQKATFAGVARFGAVAFSLNGKAYLGTGFTDNFPFFMNDFWEYDPNDANNGLDINGNPMGAWTQKNDFGGGARMEAVCFTVGTKAYVGTGGNYMSGTALFNDFWEYDPSADSWTHKTSFGGAPRSLAVGFSTGNKGYVGIGGDFNTTSFPDFWEFDPTDASHGLDANNNPAGGWIKVADFGGVSRWLASAFAVNDTGYVATGGNFVPSFKDLWSYGPAPAPPNTTGIRQNQHEAELIISQVPGKKELKIMAPDDTFEIIEIYTVTGEKIYSGSIYQQTNIDLTCYSEAIYIVRGRTSQESFVKKIILR